MKKYLLYVVGVLVLGSNSAAIGQGLLTLEEAIITGTENNLGLQIAKRSETIASNNASRAAAGQIPSVGLNSNASFRSQNTKIEFSSPGIETVDVSGAGSLIFGASIDVNYVLFRGFQHQYQYELLQGNSAISSIETRIRLENLVYQIIGAYSSVQASTVVVETARQAVEVSMERYERTEEALRLGTGTSLTMMEAEVALQQDSVRLAAAEQASRSQKRRLNRLIQRDPDVNFSVEPDIEIGTALDLESLLEKALTTNTQMQLVRRRLTNAKISEKIARASLWPTLSASASYAYNHQDNEAGLIVSQNTLGPVGGLSLTFPIFDGGLRTTQIENARLLEESSELALTDQELQLRTDLANAFDQYQIALEQMERELSNIRLAETVLERTQQLIELGQLSQLDFRTAQLNLQRSKDILIQYKLSAKQAELDLLLLSGMLVE